MLDPNAFCGLLVDNRYRLQTFLGSGAFGYVFAAEELALGETVGHVAVKLIRPQSDAHRQSVLSEIRSMAGLSHPHLLGYRSAGEVQLKTGEKLIFLALELAEDALDSVLARGAMVPVETLRMAQDIASALVYLEKRGIVHRDLKPANILRVGPSWKIADFGIARSTSQGALLTAAAGTLAYMSPDAIDGEVGSPGDMWAFAVILQECLTGRFPYSDASQLSFIRQVAHSEPFIASGLPRPFDEIIRHCLVKDPRTRWTASQVLTALGSLSHQTPPAPVPPSPPSPTPSPVQLPVASPPSAAPVLQHQLTEVMPRQPQDLVIDAAGKGNYRTLSEALRGAPQASRFWVRPGIYRESVILDRTVVIVGEGEREKIIIECGVSNSLKVTAGRPTVRGLTLIGVARSHAKQYHAVSATGGELTLEDCMVSGDSLSCIAVQGASANLQLRNCLITKAGRDGVLFSQGAQGIVENCQITENARHGLHIKDDATPTIINCGVIGNGGSGIYLAAGKCTVEDCEIRRNRKTGVHIGTSGSMSIYRCNITDNKQQGISVQSGASSVIEDCDLRSNVFGAWAIGSGTPVQRRNNKEG